MFKRKLPDYFYRPQTKLREGNVFTGVCDSVHGGCLLPGGLVPGGLLLGGLCLLPGGVWSRRVPGGDPPTATVAGGTHPTGMHFLYFRTFY